MDDKINNPQEGEIFDSKYLFRSLLDPVAHYVMARNGAEHNLLSFINAVFEDKKEPQVERITLLNPFDPKTFPNEKRVIVDILAEDENQRIFTIEFQVWDHKYFIERGVYYWARAYSRQLTKGIKYKGLHPVVSIFLTDFQNSSKFGSLYERQTKRIHQSFSIRSDETPEMVLTNHLNLHLLQLPKEINAQTLGEVCTSLADWLTFFGYPVKTTEVDMEKVVKRNPGIAAAFDDYQTFHQDPELRIVAEGSERFRRDMEAYVETCEERAKAIGVAEVTIRMLKEGMNIKDIARLTGLSEEEVKDLSPK